MVNEHEIYSRLFLKVPLQLMKFDQNVAYSYRCVIFIVLIAELATPVHLLMSFFWNHCIARREKFCRGKYCHRIVFSRPAVMAALLCSGVESQCW